MRLSSTDDHALDFLLQYRDELFPNTPVIFSGLNAFPPDRLQGKTGFSGVYESYDVEGTVKLMLSIHPDTESITTITDDTRSGRIFYTLIKNVEAKFNDRIHFNTLHNQTPEEIVSSLKNLPEKSLVLWAIYIRTPSGKTLSSHESVSLISESSHYPTYCVWDVVGQGVVGGKITSPVYQGEMAANMVNEVLKGKDVNALPIVGSPLEYIFDYQTMKRFSIEENQLPKNRTIINKPINFYEEHKDIVWLVSIILCLFVIVIAALVVLLVMSRKKTHYENIAMRDQLTGVFNRHYLLDVAPAKLAESLRHKTPCCLLVVDLDHFKNINDTFGHLVGDKVLKRISEILQQQNRTEDLVARYGGEEFVILLNYCDENQAMKTAERVRAKVENSKIIKKRVTVSIGLTEYRGEGDSFQDMFERADQALYEAKEHGRNKVKIK